MRISGYENDDLIPIGLFADQLKPPRSISCVRQWITKGSLNRLTNLRVKLAKTRLTNGGYAVSIRDYEAFMAALNQKP